MALVCFYHTEIAVRELGSSIEKRFSKQIRWILNPFIFKSVSDKQREHSSYRKKLIKICILVGGKSTGNPYI